MSTYVLTIRKTEPNPEFEKEVEMYEKNMRGGNYSSYDRDQRMMPNPHVTKDVLMMELTVEQFNKLKKEALVVFE